MASSATFYFAKEGRPFNTTTQEHNPTCIWNDTEDPSLPMSEDSLAALTCDLMPVIDCKECLADYEFAMASTYDLTIKKFTPDVEERSVYVDPLDVTYYPINAPFFPNTSVGVFDTEGYPTLIQGEASLHNSKMDKFITAINVIFDFKPQTESGLLFAQAGVSNTPHCLDWFNDQSRDIDCNRGRASDIEPSLLRPARPVSFGFYRVGYWMAYRLFVATNEDDPNYSPKGCSVYFNELTLSLQQKSETWTNQ